jgi:hypothetical protein
MCKFHNSGVPPKGSYGPRRRPCRIGGHRRLRGIGAARPAATRIRRQPGRDSAWAGWAESPHGEDCRGYGRLDAAWRLGEADRQRGSGAPREGSHGQVVRAVVSGARLDDTPRLDELLQNWRARPSGAPRRQSNSLTAVSSSSMLSRIRAQTSLILSNNRLSPQAARGRLKLPAQASARRKYVM